MSLQQQLFPSSQDVFQGFYDIFLKLWDVNMLLSSLYLSEDLLCYFRNGQEYLSQGNQLSGHCRELLPFCQADASIVQSRPHPHFLPLYHIPGQSVSRSVRQVSVSELLIHSIQDVLHHLQLPVSYRIYQCNYQKLLL